MSAHESTAKTPGLAFSTWLSAPRESKRRHKALSVRAVCLDLTLVCVPEHVCMSASVCTYLCGAPHQRMTEWLSCYDLWPWHAPRQREGGGGGGGGGKRHIHTRPHAKVHAQGKSVGYTRSPNVQQLQKKKRGTMTDRRKAICLVNFYWANKSLYARTLKHYALGTSSSAVKLIPSPHWTCPTSVLPFPRLNQLQMLRMIFICFWYEHRGQM